MAKLHKNFRFLDGNVVKYSIKGSGGFGMQLGMEMSIRQTQQLVLTPQMEQALSVLQMGAEELNQYIEDGILSNPMLAYAKPEQGKEVSQSYGERTIYRKGGYADWDRQSYLNAIADEKSYDTQLKEYLRMQLFTRHVSKSRQKRAEFLIECLEESGYLKVPMSDLAKSLDISEAKLEQEISFLQGFEPCGVFARSLKECLLLQLQNEGEFHKNLRFLVSRFLQEIAENKLPEISRQTGWSVSEVADYVKYIKEQLEPIPGRGFGTEREAYIYPDITVKSAENGYRIIYNKERMHAVTLNEEYLPLLSGAHQEWENQYLKEQYQKAKLLIHNVNKREETLRMVAASILDYQMDFFEKGKAFLKPMNLYDVAQELGVHESTVSRTIKDKYLECRWGVFEFKYFFSNKTSEGNNCNVLTRIEEIIRSEDKRKPLSDEKISKQLEKMGIIISRRTVTKYREQLQIPKTQMRKEYV